MERLKDKFIVSEKIDEKRIREFTERLLPFCKVTKSGGVIIERAELTTVEKIGIALAARFLANSLDSEISPEVNGEELSNSLMIPKNQVLARLKELRDEKFAFRVSKGVYKVNPFKIDDLLKSLENKRKVRK
jgi:hypothetical protein